MTLQHDRSEERVDQNICGSGHLHGLPGVQVKVPSRVVSSQDVARMWPGYAWWGWGMGWESCVMGNQELSKPLDLCLQILHNLLRFAIQLGYS